MNMNIVQNIVYLEKKQALGGKKLFLTFKKCKNKKKLGQRSPDFIEMKIRKKMMK
jgi:hypothetical protein